MFGSSIMLKINRYFFFKLAVVYYLSLFLFIKFYYVPNDGEDNTGLASKLSKLSAVSKELSQNLTHLQVSLLDMLAKNDSFKISNVSFPGGLANDGGYTYQVIEEIAKRSGKLVYVHSDGRVIVNKTLLAQKLENSLWKWDHTSQTVAFMHIGKNGGTSFRAGLNKAKSDKGCQLKNTAMVRQPQKYTCPGPVFCVCNKHYDWTTIETMKRKGVDVAVLSLLRSPVSRAVSHFYFAQGLPWTKGTKMRQQTLGSYLHDPMSMLDTRDVWQDGQAAVSWFSATHIGSWVVTLSESEKQSRETRALDWTGVLNTALDNLHQSLWVGILEKIDQSLELLRYQSGFHVKLGHSNKNKKKHPVPTEQDITALRKLIPLDLWFYEYASQLHDFKWKIYKLYQSGKSPTPEELRSLSLDYATEMVSRLPKRILGCKSTRFIISCPDDKEYFQWNVTDRRVNAQQRALLPKSWS